jgi:cytochrome c oxidase assembly protein subunit 11
VPGKAGAARRRRNSQVDRSRWITVEFDANARGPWDFKPGVRSLQVHPGELATVMYEFRTCRTAPWPRRPSRATRRMQAAAHFNKLECFCFNEYTLARRSAVAGGLRDRPQAAQGRDHHHLSYTFFEVGGKVPAAPQGQRGAARAA